MTRPNVLWIMADQHNADCMGSAGHPDVRTPNLDGLARDGTRFSAAMCNAPLCAPSRASFLTGEYVHTHGISGNQVYDTVTSHPDTVALRFRRSGYRTGLIGKGHLPRTWMEDGFEHRRYCDLADGEPNDPLSVAYFRHLVEHGLADDYDLGSLPPGHPGADLSAFVSTIPAAHSLETWTGDEALAFLSEEDGGDGDDRPFFLKLSFQRPHEPYTRPADTDPTYDPGKLELPDGAADYLVHRFAGKPASQREYAAGGPGGYPYRPRDEDDLREQLSFYYGLITAIDEQVGRVLDHLKATGRYEDTVVVYTADHGDFAGEHGLMLKNLGVYEAVQRIPMLLAYPGGPRGQVCDELVESVDLYPTLCGLAGLETPAHVEGRSMAEVALGRAPGKDDVVCEVGKDDQSLFALRTPGHRLVVSLADVADGELYDRRDDPGELRNLYRDPAHQAVRADLLARLLGHVGRFRREWSASHRDGTAADTSPGFSRLLHKRHAKWSDMAHFFGDAAGGRSA